MINRWENARIILDLGNKSKILVVKEFKERSLLCPEVKS